MKKILLFWLTLATCTALFSQNSYTYSLSKTEIDFGDTYIRSTKTDSMYIVASASNPDSITLKILFDENRIVGCFDFGSFTSPYIVKNIFKVSIDGTQLHATYSISSANASESDMGNSTIKIASGDSALVVIEINPETHNVGMIQLEGDCLVQYSPFESIGIQSDVFTIQNISIMSTPTTDIEMKFTGTQEEEVDNPTGLFSSSNGTRFCVFPNPATSIINTEEGQLEILDLSGNSVLNTESAGTVDISYLEPGIYFVIQNSKRTKLIIE